MPSPGFTSTGQSYRRDKPWTGPGRTGMISSEVITMAIIIPPEIEDRAREAALREGIDPDTFVVAAIVERASRVGLVQNGAASTPAPNLGMLLALRKAREIQKDMPMTPGDSVAIIREGRAGSIYGSEPCE